MRFFLQILDGKQLGSVKEATCAKAQILQDDELELFFGMLQTWRTPLKFNGTTSLFWASEPVCIGIHFIMYINFFC